MRWWIRLTKSNLMRVNFFNTKLANKANIQNQNIYYNWFHISLVFGLGPLLFSCINLISININFIVTYFDCYIFWWLHILMVTYFKGIYIDSLIYKNYLFSRILILNDLSWFFENFRIFDDFRGRQIWTQEGRFLFSARSISPDMAPVKTRFVLVFRKF